MVAALLTTLGLVQGSRRGCSPSHWGAEKPHRPSLAWRVSPGTYNLGIHTAVRKGSSYYNCTVVAHSRLLCDKKAPGFPMGFPEADAGYASHWMSCARNVLEVACRCRPWLTGRGRPLGSLVPCGVQMQKARQTPCRPRSWANVSLF